MLSKKLSKMSSATRREFELARAERREKRIEARASASSRGYDADWRRFRETFISSWRSYGAPCALCGRPIVDAPDSSLEVDHIETIRERPDLRLTPANCRVLHKACHSRRTAQYEADKRRGFGVEAQVDGTPSDPAHPWNAPRG